MVYCYTKMGEWDFGVCSFFGSGLGNLLLPWARAMVVARRDGLVEIWPTWRQFLHRDGFRDAIKDMLGVSGVRGLRNYRHLFAPTGTQICGFRKLWLLLTCRRVSERDYGPGLLAELRGSIVVFNPCGETKTVATFADMLHEHAFLRKELLNRCSLDLSKVMAFDFSRSISIHVRLGDFRWVGHFDEIKKHPANIRIPQSWYVDKITQLRSRCGSSVPVHVFSDGNDSELAEILALPNCRRVGFGNALADLFAMARASVLLCSRSNLSLWGAFLGRPPIIHPRGLAQTPLYYDQPDGEVESGLDEDLPETFLRRAEAALSRPKQAAPFS